MLARLRLFPPSVFFLHLKWWYNFHTTSWSFAWAEGHVPTMRNPFSLPEPTPEIKEFLEAERRELRKAYPGADLTLKDGVPEIVYSRGFYPHKNSKADILGEPFFAILKEDVPAATPEELADPRCNPIIVLEISKHHFLEWVTFLPGGNYRKLWIGAMAAYTDSTRTFLVQDGRERAKDVTALYCIATFMSVPFIFGKVVPGRFREDALKKFDDFLFAVGDGRNNIANVAG